MSGRRSDDDGFGHSLTDLMASVAVMFLLIAAIFMVRSLSQAQRSKDAAQRFEDAIKSVQADDKTSRDALRDLVSELRADAAVEGVKIDYDPTKDPYVATLVFDEELLHFDVGADRLDAAGQAAVRRIGPTLLERTCALVNSTGRVDQINLEGHTDNQPFGGCPQHEAQACTTHSFEQNVQLSADRAQRVYFALREAIAGKRDLLDCLNSRFVVSGRGPVEPMAATASWEAPQTEEERRRNRRVVIKIRIRSDIKSLTEAQTP